MDEHETYKVVVVGSECTGKSALVQSYLFNVFPAEHIPTIKDTFTTPRPVHVPGTINVHRMLAVDDIGGSREIENLRPLWLPDAHVVIIVYSCVNRKSFLDVQRRWWPLVQHQVPGVPVIVVACKSDARPGLFVPQAGQLGEGVGEDEGQTLARELGAAGFVECSALNDEGLEQVWSMAVKLAETAAQLKTGRSKNGPTRRSASGSRKRREQQACTVV